MLVTCLLFIIDPLNRDEFVPNTVRAKSEGYLYGFSYPVRPEGERDLPGHRPPAWLSSVVPYP